MTRPGRAALLTVLVLLLAAAAGVGGWFGADALRRPAAPPTPPPAALGSATASPSAPATGGPTPAAVSPRAVAARLAGPLSAPDLGSDVLAQVLDARSGTVLYSRGATTPAAPASTAKLLTAAAALSVYPATQRFATAVVPGGAAGTVVLVGGGDPTLTAAPAGRPGAYREAARVSDLAAALKAKHVAVDRILVDDALFAAPGVSPRWAPEDVPSDYASPITALMVDGGRDAPGDVIRSDAPDLAAGRALAAALGRPGLPVTRGTAPAGRTPLASVQSAPLSVLVEQMLESSDNVIAEVLARHVAIARHQPATFAGAAAAVKAVVGGAGVPEHGVMYDGSGLAAADRLDPATLAAVLHLAVTTPRLHRLLAGLPVAAWSGTLNDRYLTGSPAGAAGDVRAKTGTLTSVSTLAGVVHTAAGQLLAFTFMADRVPPGVAGTDAAEEALDRVAAALASCGCS